MVDSDIDGESKMKKLYLTAIGIAALGLATPASAADMAARPYKAPPPVVAPIYDWSGFYIGANGGWGNSHNCWDFVTLAGTVFRDGCRDRSGGLIGGANGGSLAKQSVLVWMVSPRR